MKVILKSDVLSLGETGDIVNVADGYARNFLLPSNVAEKATDGALKKREMNLARIKAKAEKFHKQASEDADKIKALETIKIKAKAGETGKLYGAITTRQLAQIIQEKASVEVDRKNISISSPINHVGEFKLLIKMTSKVSVELPVEVEADIVQEYMTEEFKQEMDEMEHEKEAQKAEQQEHYKKLEEERASAEVEG